MAKKKMIVVDYDKELTPVTLAIKEDKKKASIFGIVWIVLIFGIFILGVIYLPDIASYVNSYFNPDVVTPSGGNNNKNNGSDDTDNDDEKIKEYVISDNLEITFDSFKINNIKKENNKISMDIVNTSNEILDLSKYNYFINMYSESKTLLKRVMLGDVIVSVGNAYTVSYDIDDNVYMLSVYNLSKEDYPAYVVTSDESNMGTLTCTKEYEKIDYLTNNNKVYAINILNEVSSSDANFNTLYATYQAMKNTYDNVEGISSSLDVINNVLTFRSIINLNVVIDGSINLKSYYPKDTDAKVIYFEMTSMGYTCK